jgi:hypothetical protein
MIDSVLRLLPTQVVEEAVAGVFSKEATQQHSITKAVTLATSDHLGDVPCPLLLDTIENSLALLTSPRSASKLETTLR